ncbi:MAG: GNAT family N-acetyltransferase [Xanthomonadaceae bacterium]|jgi:GNAT superfamily N-acetyltransferase|nr:GNAT family N-acetyltransferase [Xanthomonadaceae bacterium]
MSKRNRLPPWHEYFSLPNGRQLLIRPLRAEDNAPLIGALPLLGPLEIRQRFLYPANELTADAVQRLVQFHPKTEIVLTVAESLPPGEAVIAAVARAGIVPNTRKAQYAILVSDFVAGMGLGRNLLLKLSKWARRRYLDSLYGEISEANLPMLQLAASLGFKPDPQPPAPGLIRVELNLDPENRC